MTDYKNKEDLKKIINEGYFEVNSYEKISNKGLLVEKVLSMAKNDKDDVFRQIKALVEEVMSDETELSPKVDVDSFIDKAKTEENSKSSVIDKLPMTTLAIKKLDAENIESLKWIIFKKTEKVFDKKKIFSLNDSEFKKFLCGLFRGEVADELKDNEVEFTDKAVADNTVEPLVESFIKFAGRSINEENEIYDENDPDSINYYYLVKKQIDTLGDESIRNKVDAAYSVISFDSVEKDVMDMVDDVPEAVQDKVKIAYVKDAIDRHEFGDDIEGVETDILDTNEDSDFSELADQDAESDDEFATIQEQLERQKELSEELKQLYIIKMSKDRIMLESSSVLRSINYKKELLKRTLMYEEALGNKDTRAYCEKLMKINTLTECLIRKYLPRILE